MTANILFYPNFKGIDSNGNPISGGKLYSYEVGTETPTPLYQDIGCTVEHTNPVTLDASGEETIYLNTSVDLVLKTSALVTVWGPITYTLISIAAADLPTAIDAAKIGDGSVSNAEFQYLNGVTSAIQTQINTKLAAASQAQMEAAAVATVAVTPVVAQYHPGTAKGWVYWTGNSTTILASHNVNSLTDGTNTTTINWETDFSSVNYCVVAGVNKTNGGVWQIVDITTMAAGTTLLEFLCVTGDVGDPLTAHAVAFGDQT